MTDPNYGHLRAARAAGLATFSGDILSTAAEHRVELVSYATVVAATDNDAYNTLVATDLAPEFGRENVFQVTRHGKDNARRQLPATLGGRSFGPDLTNDGFEDLVNDGWTFRVTRLSDEFTLEDWRASRPDAHMIAWISAGDVIRFVSSDDEVKQGAGVRIVSLRPADAGGDEQPPAD